MVNKIKSLGVLSGLVLLSSKASAATLAWVAIGAQAVPMSFTSMMVLAGMFLIVGVFLLQKMQNQGARFFMLALLVVGTFGLTTVAKATSNILEITDGSDPVVTIDDNAVTEVRNGHTDAIKITSITPSEGCAVVPGVAPICQINTPLANGQSCYVTIECDLEEESEDGDYEGET